MVDASVWVSWLVVADERHGASRSWFVERVERDDLVVAPALVLAEIAGAVARRTSSSALGVKAVSLVTQLPNARLVPVDLELAEFGAETAADYRLRGADALYVAVASRLGLPLVTWDQEQLERGRGAAETMTPQESLVR